jgi:outer membrane protein, heavy metal efflux system
VVHHIAEAALSPIETSDIDDPLAGSNELSLELLIAAVQARNPSLHVAQAAWSAAAERCPQAVALDDPMFQSMFAPASFPSSSPVQSSYYLGMAQRVPWHGKRELKGQVAQWEAAAMSWDTQEVMLRLASAARMAFFDYYLVERELELNTKNMEVMQDFRSTAKSKYEANQVSQQDLSSADLELAKLQQQRLELEQSQRTAVARINTLLHRRPDHPLPSPPSSLAVETPLPEAIALRELARQHRPELAAIAARVQSEQNAVALACKEYYPDFEFMARYDAFWTDTEQRPQVGMNMNVPLNKSRRAAAVREAQFRVSKLLAEYAQQQDSVNEEVQVACGRVEANRKAAELFEDRILPAADTNLDAARAAYIAGSIDFLQLMDARRQFIEQQIGYQRILTEYHRSRSDLERAVGTQIGQTAIASEVPAPTPAVTEP